MVKKENKIVTPSDRDAQIQKAAEEVKEIQKFDKVKKFLEDNIIEFDYKGNTYRVRRPVPKEREEVNRERILIHTKLLSKKDSDGDYMYMCESDLMKLYLDRGIDIAGLRATAKSLNDKKESLSEKLGKLLSDDSNDKDQQTLKKQIEALDDKLRELSINISTYMDISIEQQVLVRLYSYLAYVTTEIKDGENWKKYWKNFEEFQNGDEGLINHVTLYATLITNEISNLDRAEDSD